MSAPASPAPSRPRSRRGPLLLLAALGAVLALGAGAPTWVSGVARTASGTSAVVVDGRDAAPVATALALVALAAVVASTLGRRFARLLAALVLVLAGAGVVSASVGTLTHPATALAAPARAVSGTTQARLEGGAALRPWPVVSAAGGALVAVAGLGAFAASRRAGAPAGPTRHERDATRVVATPAEDPAAAWDSLTHGDDPTR
ncbi:Trp biosynthesis-associated membrane protein [Kineococcus rhizosphaerae]|uniref:Putative membrane protein (TIGR02234 family) n=1 Tax=Kineococcus rhizosphaerae TaxID=559628 RepID=A0A2T0R9X3_9ACTN|nr:Trp biosynthesis-associated membrane protein [Kineococcus rhizosphaerae]PRY17968.1 putative membrane protein (TIGR02234 family) [Kineococcus rhizosphaerae]